MNTAPGVHNKEPTVWPDGARPNQRYICKYIKIENTELYINNIQFRNIPFSNGNYQIVLFGELYTFLFLYPSEAHYEARSKGKLPLPTNIRPQWKWQAVEIFKYCRIKYNCKKLIGQAQGTECC